MADYNDITSATIAVVFQQDGLDDFYPCHSGIEIDQAQQEIRAAGGTPRAGRRHQRRGETRMTGIPCSVCGSHNCLNPGACS